MKLEQIVTTKKFVVVKFFISFAHIARRFFEETRLFTISSALPPLHVLLDLNHW